jgi:hypothetical protein
MRKIKALDRLMLLLGFLLLLGVGTIPAAPAPEPQDETPPIARPIEGSAPNIQFENTEHDFGHAKQRIQLKHAFSFKNTGDSELLIERVKSG